MKRVVVSVCSDVGNTRKNNEDNLVVNEFFNKKSSDFIEQDMKSSYPCIAGVFDGMGGTKNGERASLLCAEMFSKTGRIFKQSKNISKDLISIYSKINRTLLKEQIETKSDLATTACVVVVTKENIYCSNVGDSRIYLFEDDDMRLVSTDDNQAQLLIDSNSITAEQAKNHPSRNVLMQYMGMGLEDEGFEPEPHITVIEREKGTEYRLLICSDGLYSFVDEEEMKKDVLDDEYNAANILVEKAIDNNSTDNVTAVVLTF